MEWRKASVEAANYRRIIGIYVTEFEFNEKDIETELLTFYPIQNVWHNKMMYTVRLKDLLYWIPIPEEPKIELEGEV